MRFIGNSGSFRRHEFNLEKEFEKNIYRFSEELFRGGMIVRWEPRLECGLSGEGVKPDSLLVNLDLDEWWVVEVELGRRKKIPDMVDQLGKLSRVDYTKHRVDIRKGLRDMGLSEVEADKKSKYFSSISPNFMLILDEKNDEMMSQAVDRGFVPLVVETFRNSNKEIRLRIPSEHPLTIEPDPEKSATLKLRAPQLPDKPIVQNGSWWYFLPDDSPISNYKSITITDGEGSFVAPYAKAGSIALIQLPVDRNSISAIIKGNKSGILTEDSMDGTYVLKLKWT